MVSKKTGDKKSATVSKVAKKTTVKKATPASTTKKSATLPSGDVLMVIETGGKQYRVFSGDTIKIEKISGEHKKGDTVVFDRVLLVDDGENLKIGAPYIVSAKVEGEFIETGRDKKISVIKFKRKVRYFRKYGHRQPYTKIKIR